MNQNIWGPHLWFSLHTISFNYPLNPTQEERNNFKNFFLNLQEVIPCSICKKNYIRHLKEHPIDNFLNNRKSLVYWVIDMHNMVNGEIGKKILSYDLVIKKYEEVYKKKIELNNNDDNYKKNNNKVNYKKLIYGLFILLLLLLLINFINLFLKN
jgi:hypothetical protein